MILFISSILVMSLFLMIHNFRIKDLESRIKTHEQGIFELMKEVEKLDAKTKMVSTSRKDLH